MERKGTKEYDEYYTEIIKDDLGFMFEYATIAEKLDIDVFGRKFIESKVCAGFEDYDPFVIMGKSAAEHLEDVLGKKYDHSLEVNSFYTSEYWVGWVYGWANGALGISFKDLIMKYPPSKLLEDYHPYHEMDITQIFDKIVKTLGLIIRVDGLNLGAAAP